MIFPSTYMHVFNNTENQNQAVFIFSVFINLETRQISFENNIIQLHVYMCQWKQLQSYPSEQSALWLLKYILIFSDSVTKKDMVWDIWNDFYAVVSVLNKGSFSILVKHPFVIQTKKTLILKELWRQVNKQTENRHCLISLQPLKKKSGKDRITHLHMIMHELTLKLIHKFVFQLNNGPQKKQHNPKWAFPKRLAEICQDLVQPAHEEEEEAQDQSPESFEDCPSSSCWSA